MSVQSRLKDRVFETSTTQGTGTITLAGAVTGARRFSDAFSNGDRVYYAITVEASGQFEVGLGTYISANQLSRDTVFASSANGAAVNWGSGTRNVFCAVPAKVIATLSEDLSSADYGKFVVIKNNGTLGVVNDVSLDAISVDSISEKTLDHGVYIDNIVIKDGGMTLSNLITTSAAINFAKGSAVASASTTNIWGSSGNFVHITGTTAITSLGTAPQAGVFRFVTFDGVLTLTNGANLILPSAVNITTAAGDCAIFISDSTTQIRCLAYMRADGKAITAPTKSEVGLSNVQNIDQTNAANLTSGTVATARLGSGTASPSTFLRGDGAWSSIVGSYLGVGSYVVARSSVTATPGSTVSGANLIAATAGSTAVSSDGTNLFPNISTSGSTLSGTFLCMGYAVAYDANKSSSSLFLRIA